MASLAEIFGRIVGDEYTGVCIADYLSENPHAKANDLVKFRGVGMNVANTLLMVMESSAEYLAGTRAVSVNSPDVIAHQFSWMRWEMQEHFVLVSLDSQNHIINKHMVTKGLVNEVKVAPRETFRFAIMDNAVSVIIAHNHPSGNTEPSREDLNITRVLCASGKILEIPVLDHIIVSRSGCTSIRHMYPEIFEL